MSELKRSVNPNNGDDVNVESSIGSKFEDFLVFLMSQISYLPKILVRLRPTRVLSDDLMFSGWFWETL